MQASDFTPLIAECCGEVLDAMYFTSVFDTTHQPGLQPELTASDLAFALRFQGDVRGVFGLHLAAPMARTLAANFLGEDEDAISDEEIAEVVGELANMLCGSIVSKVEGHSKFVLSHPQPVTSLAESPLDILCSTLDTDSGPIHTWIILDPGPQLPQLSSLTPQSAVSGTQVTP
jgi:CheY-specific phosphatase CheX